MDFTDLANSIINNFSSYANAHPVVAAVAVIVALFLLYRKPLAVLMTLGLVLLLVGVLYMILQMGGSGVSTKKRMIKNKSVPENIFRAMPLLSNAGDFDIPRISETGWIRKDSPFHIKD